MDKDMRKTNKVISILKFIISGAFLIIKNKIIISLNKIVYDNIQKMYETNYNTVQQTMLKDSDIDNDKLSTLSEMWLCFTELIILVSLSILSIYIKEKVFIFIFILEIIAVFYAKKTISGYYKMKKTNDKYILRKEHK